MCRRPPCGIGNNICCFACDEPCKCDEYDVYEFAVDCPDYIEQKTKCPDRPNLECDWVDIGCKECDMVGKG